MTIARRDHGTQGTDVALHVLRCAASTSGEDLFNVAGDGGAGISPYALVANTDADGGYAVLVVENEDGDIVGAEVIDSIRAVRENAIPNPLTPDELDRLWGASPEDRDETLYERYRAWARDEDARWEADFAARLLDEPTGPARRLGTVHIGSGRIAFDGPATGGPRPIDVTAGDWVAVAWGDQYPVDRIGLYRPDYAATLPTKD